MQWTIWVVFLGCLCTSYRVNGDGGCDDVTEYGFRLPNDPTVQTCSDVANTYQRLCDPNCCPIDLIPTKCCKTCSGIPDKETYDCPLLKCEEDCKFCKANSFKCPQTCSKEFAEECRIAKCKAGVEASYCPCKDSAFFKNCSDICQAENLDELCCPPSNVEYGGQKFTCQQLKDKIYEKGHDLCELSISFREACCDVCGDAGKGENKPGSEEGKGDNGDDENEEKDECEDKMSESSYHTHNQKDHAGNLLSSKKYTSCDEIKADGLCGQTTLCCETCDQGHKEDKDDYEHGGDMGEGADGKGKGNQEDKDKDEHDGDMGEGGDGKDKGDGKGKDDDKDDEVDGDGDDKGKKKKDGKNKKDKGPKPTRKPKRPKPTKAPKKEKEPKKPKKDKKEEKEPKEEKEEECIVDPTMKFSVKFEKKKYTTCGELGSNPRAVRYGCCCGNKKVKKACCKMCKAHNCDGYTGCT